METKKDYIPAIGIAVIIVCIVLLTIQINADEPTVQEPSKADVELQQKIAKQKKLEAEIEKLAGRELSDEEVLGKEFIEACDREFKERR